MNKQLLPLFLVALFTGGAAFFLITSEQNETSEKGKLFPDLRETADKVMAIKLSNASGELFNAERSRDQWTVDIAGVKYPAEESRLSELVNQLADADLYEAKTNRSENYSRLGLMEISQADSQAIKVELAGGDKHYRVLVGNAASSGVGSYARLPTASQTWLLDQNISLPTETVDWLKQPIFDFTSEQVISIEKKGEQGWALFASDAATNPFVLQSMPEGRKLKYSSIVEALVNNLTELRFDDILPFENERWDSDVQPVELIVELNNQTVMMNIAEVQGEFFLRARSNVDTVDYWQSVTYKISSFGFSQLNKTLEDFLEPLVDEESQLPPVAVDEGEAPGE